MREPPQELFASDDERARYDDEGDKLPLPPATVSPPSQDPVLALASVLEREAQNEDGDDD